MKRVITTSTRLLVSCVSIRALHTLPSIPHTLADGSDVLCMSSRAVNTPSPPPTPMTTSVLTRASMIQASVRAVGSAGMSMGHGRSAGSRRIVK